MDDDNSLVASLREDLELPEGIDPHEIRKALTHRSYANEEDLTYDNERLEFLGDTILDMLVAEFLYEEYPEDREGKLSKIKSATVKTDSLTRVATKLNLDEYLRLSKGEEQEQRGRDKVIADSLEAFIGAMYNSVGLYKTREFFVPYFKQEIERFLEEGSRNYKGMLLELAQDRNMNHPVYELQEVEGPQHDPIHHVAVKIEGTIHGSGEGSTKKKAEQRAAKEALESLE